MQPGTSKDLESPAAVGLFDAARSGPLRAEIDVDRAMASVPLPGGHRRKTRSEYEAGKPFVEGDLA